LQEHLQRFVGMLINLKPIGPKLIPELNDQLFPDELVLIKTEQSFRKELLKISACFFHEI
jgi:hypothetical protein